MKRLRPPQVPFGCFGVFDAAETREHSPVFPRSFLLVQSTSSTASSGDALVFACVFPRVAKRFPCQNACVSPPSPDAYISSDEKRRPTEQCPLSARLALDRLQRRARRRERAVTRRPRLVSSAGSEGNPDHRKENETVLPCGGTRRRFALGRCLPGGLPWKRRECLRSVQTLWKSLENAERQERGLLPPFPYLLQHESTKNTEIYAYIKVGTSICASIETPRHMKSTLRSEVLPKARDVSNSPSHSQTHHRGRQRGPRKKEACARLSAGRDTSTGASTDLKAPARSA